MYFLKSYFQFTRKERNGILLLLVIVGLIWTAYLCSDYFFENNVNDYRSFEQKIDLFYKSIDSTNTSKQQTHIVSFNKDTCIVDINAPRFENLLCIGLNERLSRTWLNYILKGGKFKQIDDVKKLWGMNDSIYNIILPYLTITKRENKHTDNTNTNNEKQKNYKKAESKIIKMVELNTADTSLLKTLPGIGSSFASRIVKYRNRLGGFFSIEQLKEIYGLSKELFDKISPYVYVDVFEINKVNVNTDDYSTLIQNPYFTKETVKAILKYRKKIDKINDEKELIFNRIISEDDWAKLKWYIEF